MIIDMGIAVTSIVMNSVHLFVYDLEGNFVTAMKDVELPLPSLVRG